MKKYYILEAIKNNKEDIYNKSEFAVFDNKKLLEDEIKTLIGNGLFSKFELDFEEVNFEKLLDKTFWIYYRFNATLLENVINFDTYKNLRERFELDYKMDTRNSCMIRYKTKNCYEIWTEDYVVLGTMKEIKLNEGINYWEEQ